jgi:DnaK suppressor protein
MAERLSAAQIREFERRLRERHYELREEVRHSLMGSEDMRFQELAGRVHDSAEESVADLIHDLSIRQVDQLAQELYAVESALARLRNGTFGICSDCGQPIQLERLKAVPTAMRCIDCQRRQENEYAGVSTPTL